MVSSELFKNSYLPLSESWIIISTTTTTTITTTDSKVHPFLCESHSVCQILLYDCKLEPRRERRVNCLLPIHSVRIFHRLNESWQGNKLKYVKQDLFWHKLLYSGFRYDFENTYSPNVEWLLSLAILEKITVNLIFFPLIFLRATTNE